MTLCLHHQIPKTGTHSVVALMKDSFGEDAVSVIKQIEDRDRLGDVILVDGKQASTAHIWNDLSKLKKSTKAMSVMAPWGFQKALALDYWAFVVIREPMDRLRSYWNFCCIRASEGKPAFRSFQEANYCLDRAAGRIISLSFFNEQTRMISGSSRVWLRQEDFEQAKHVIQKEYSFVGLFENMNEILAQLGRTMGVAVTKSYHLNSAGGAYRFPLSESDIRLLNELNQWDIRLYDWLREKRVGLRSQR